MFFRFAQHSKTAVVGVLAAAITSITLAAAPAALAAPAGPFAADDPQCVLKSTGFNGVYCLWEDEPASKTPGPSQHPGPNPPPPPNSDH